MKKFTILLLAFIVALGLASPGFSNVANQNKSSKSQTLKSQYVTITFPTTVPYPRDKCGFFTVSYKLNNGVTPPGRTIIDVTDLNDYYVSSNGLNHSSEFKREWDPVSGKISMKYCSTNWVSDRGFAYKGVKRSSTLTIWLFTDYFRGRGGEPSEVTGRILVGK
jgi:hypothetical protein